MTGSLDRALQETNARARAHRHTRATRTHARKHLFGKSMTVRRPFATLAGFPRISVVSGATRRPASHRAVTRRRTCDFSAKNRTALCRIAVAAHVMRPGMFVQMYRGGGAGQYDRHVINGSSYAF